MGIQSAEEGIGVRKYIKFEEDGHVLWFIQSEEEGCGVWLSIQA